MMRNSWYVKLILLLLLVFILKNGSTQNLWTVSNAIGNQIADFDNIQEAIDFASTGDKIYVVGSTIDYDSATLDKKLHIIGFGAWFIENDI